MRIGPDTGIMPGCYFDSDYCSLISIGSNCTLSNDVFILAHDASMYRFLKYTKVDKVTIHDSCFIGARTIILPGVSIGPNAIVGAGSVIAKDIPPNSVTAGNPARVIKKIEEFLSFHNDSFSKKDFVWLDELEKRAAEIVEAKYVVKRTDRELVGKGLAR